MIEVEKLSKIYGSTTAIKNVSFAVQQGEILGFLGPNGAGKTTTMRILSGYLPATSGRAKIAGYEVHENSMAVRQLIGYLPEIPPLYPEMTVEGFLYFVTRIKRVAAGDRSRRVRLAIEKCGLLEKRKVLIRKLSKGFRQRVGIAQALVHDPQVIILDEPTVGLDPRQIIEVRNLIKSLAEEHTIILSTHILPEVSMTCNRVAIINRGELVATGSPEEMSAKLVGGWGYELEIEGEIDALERGVRLLENLPWVTALDRGKIFENNAGKNRLKITVKSREEIDYGGEITTTIVSSGLLLCEMRRTQASLEDVFLNLTAAEVAADFEADVADGSGGKKDKLAADFEADVADGSGGEKDKLAADFEADVADDLGESKELDETENKKKKVNFLTKILPSFGLKNNEERDDDET
jgi:ABC-2 type transport system ATP-binding protein